MNFKIMLTVSIYLTPQYCDPFNRTLICNSSDYVINAITLNLRYLELNPYVMTHIESLNLKVCTSNYLFKFLAETSKLSVNMHNFFGFFCFTKPTLTIVITLDAYARI